MDELKNNTQEAQEALELQEGLEALREAAKSLKGYPFIVEITAAILIDNCEKKEAKEWTEDPDLANNIFVLIDRVKSMSQELNKKDPAYARSSSFMLKYYEKIPGYKPELDPESPSFNPEQYSAAVEEMGADRFLDGVKARLDEMIKEQEAIEEMLPDLIGFGYEVQRTVSHLYMVLKSDRLLEVFRRAKAEAEAEAKSDLRIIAKQAERLLYPLDKPNSKIWNMLSEADTHGQMKMNFRTGKTKDVLVFYSINFDELDPALKISKKLTPYDKRVYIAAAALFNAGNDVITATQIFREMGNSSQPAPEQIQKIWDSLTKMRAAVIQLDNQKETETIKKYGIFKYDGQLLPFERISAYINNTLTDAAIHLFREPPLVSFARQRNQVTTITRKLLESPISKTEANLQLEDYLLERIGHMKKPNSTTPKKILFATIFNNCGIESRSQRSRAPEKIKRYLEWYKKNGWIQDYEMQDDGIQIIL